MNSWMPFRTKQTIYSNIGKGLQSRGLHRQSDGDGFRLQRRQRITSSLYCITLVCRGWNEYERPWETTLRSWVWFFRTLFLVQTLPTTTTVARLSRLITETLPSARGERLKISTRNANHTLGDVSLDNQLFILHHNFNPITADRNCILNSYA
jgi:hypothetical protein